MKKYIYAVLVLFTAMLLAVGCKPKRAVDERTPAPTESYTAQNPLPTESVTENTMPVEQHTATPTEEVRVKTASIGFVGDIMIMQSQVKNAKTPEGGYTFTRCFEPMRELFESVDLMCANLETPLAGEAVGYSGPAPTVPPATEENPNPVKMFQTFNAPDELAYDLKGLGVDVLTTANNHCLDRGIEGLYRTIDVLEDAGIYRTGTFKDKYDREKLLIIDVNGINIGILAYSGGFNNGDKQLTSSQQLSISRLYDEAFVSEQIQRIRNEGADYVIVVPHCGTELSHEPEQRHIKLFKQFVQLGADAVISSHPHVVQPIEYITVTRNSGETVKAPIVYSLGNFISNMAPAPKTYGLFVRIDVKKTETGTETVNLEYTPVYCIRQNTSVGLLHQTLPCYDDESEISAYAPLSQQDYEACADCRSFVADICGEDFMSDR